MVMQNKRQARHAARRKLASLRFHLTGKDSFVLTVGKAGGLSWDRRLFIPCRKVKYGHKATADKAGDAMNGKTGDDYDSYYCRQCRAWHIGHRRG